MLGAIKGFMQRYLLKKAINNGLQLGEDCRILGNPNFGSEPYLIKIGSKCTITSGVKFVTHDGGTWVFREDPKYNHIKKYGKIEIGSNCFIGIDSIIMPNVTIGDNCVIGAGSIVTKDIPDNSVAVGCPAKIIMTLEEYIQRCEQNRTVFPEKLYESKREFLTRHFWG